MVRQTINFVLSFHSTMTITFQVTIKLVFIPTSSCLFSSVSLPVLSFKGVTCPAMTMESEGLIVSPPICANSSSVLGYATECYFTCKSGYQLQGPGLKTCAQSRNWIPIGNPSCRGVCLLWYKYYYL